jgi:antitoxin FitA
MPSITIRDVPADVRDELAARAARSGRSLQEHLRSELIEIVKRPDARDLIARAQARAAATSSSLPARRILELRDPDRP